MPRKSWHAKNIKNPCKRHLTYTTLMIAGGFKTEPIPLKIMTCCKISKSGAAIHQKIGHCGEIVVARKKFLLDSVTDHKSGSLVGFVLKSKLGSLDHRKYDDDVWEDQREVETVGAKTKIKPLVMRDDWAFSNKFLGFEWISSRHEKWFNNSRRKGAWPNTLCVEKLEIQTDQLMNGCKTIWLC